MQKNYQKEDLNPQKLQPKYSMFTNYIILVMRIMRIELISAVWKTTYLTIKLYSQITERMGLEPIKQQMLWQFSKLLL